MVELLKQPQYVPMPVIDQVLSIFSASKGFMDEVETKNVADFEKGLLNYFSTTGKALRDELATKKAIDKDLEKKLLDACSAFKGSWKAK